MTAHLEQQEEEIQRLKDEIKALQEQNTKLKTKKNGCLIALIVVGSSVCLLILLSIVAAIALPMYSKFQRKAKFDSAVKSVFENKVFLDSWYDQGSNLEGISVPEAGGSLIHLENSMGAQLSEKPGLSWAIESDKDTIIIRFAYDNCQGDSICSGFVMADDQGDGTLTWTVYDAEENLHPNP